MANERTITTEVVEYVQSVTHDSISDDVRQELHRCIVDGLAVMLSGSVAACSRIIHQYIRDTNTTGVSAAVGTDIVTSASLAALANGVAGHADDFDDTQLAQTPDRIYGLLTHPTVPALASAMAVGVTSRQVV